MLLHSICICICIGAGVCIRIYDGVLIALAAWLPACLVALLVSYKTRFAKKWKTQVK